MLKSVEEEQGLKKTNEKHNYNLDLMKIFACIAVVGLHTLQKDISLINTLFYYVCGFAVPVFFMSTGYILLNRDQINFKYSLRKIISIIRVVCLWSLLFFCIEMMVGVLKNSIAENNFILLFFKILIGGLVQRGRLWQFWYLGALICVYMILPILMKYRKYLEKIWIICVILAIVMQGLSYIFKFPLQSHCIQTFRLWTWLQYFILGGLIGKIHDMIGYIKNITFKKHTVILFIITGVIPWYQNFIGKLVIHNSYAEYFYDSLLTILWIIVLFTWVMKLSLKQWVIKIIKYIAPVTMGVYIIHPIIIMFALKIVSVETVLTSFAFFGIVLVVAFFIAKIIYKIPKVKKLIEL